jgi:hypothetical protein
VVDERADGGTAERGETDEAEVVAEFAGLFGFADRLGSVSNDAGDADDGRLAVGVGSIHLFGCECEDRLQQAD